MRASLAASLIITETYLSLCNLLLLPGLFARTPKRLCLLATTGVFCIVSETYLYFALPSLRQTPGHFERTPHQLIWPSRLHSHPGLHTCWPLADILYPSLLVELDRVQPRNQNQVLV